MINYEKLIKALRCKRDDCEGCDLAFFDKDEGWMCRYAAKDDDAADAIEALQAELAGSKDAVRILKYNLERMKDNHMNQIEKEMVRLKREIQDESISKFADGEWWKEMRK